ncbi:MAG: hypothetical protein F7C34_00670 [Desulfurococcales archaeon]|nr:hypothetical protein [Desulfurococcales archaeon]
MPRVSVNYGTIILIDIDRMSEVIREKGWSEYRPNPSTGKLSGLVELFARKWSAVIIYGLDWERGTEEAVIEIPGAEPEEVEADLKHIACEMAKTGVTVTIVAITGPTLGRPARDRRSAYAGPRRRAKRVLEALKRRGGGFIYVEGRTARVQSLECAKGNMEEADIDSATDDASRQY